MVELTLDLVEQARMPDDTFVSVRIGDSQKLSRLADSRTYSFANVADTRYGRIEVFQRIGSCSVDIDPVSEACRERPVSINCQESGFGRLALRVGVETEPSVKEKRLANLERSGKKQSAKVRAAKEYLGKHGLEMMLSEAMQVVLRERPDNPTEFIGRRFLGEANPTPKGSRLPPVTPKSKPSPPMPESRKPVIPNETPVVPASANRVQPRLTPLTEKQRSSQQQRLPEKLTTSSIPAVRQCESVVPFGKYYKGNFSIVTFDQGLRRLYGSFPPPRRTVLDRGTVSCGLRTSGSEIRGSFASSVPFREYCNANMRQCGTTFWSSLHSKFGGRDVETMQSDLASILFRAERTGDLRRAVQEVLPSKISKMRFLPSVGTWLAKPIQAVQMDVDRELPTPFVFRASVGTWLVPLPSEDAVMLSDLLFEPAVSHVILPSVATWLAKPTKLKRLVSEDKKTLGS